MLANRRPVLSVLEWGEIVLPASLNTSVVKKRLVRAGDTALGESIRFSRGRLFANGLVGLVSSCDVQIQILPKVGTVSDPNRGLKLLQNLLSIELDFLPNVRDDSVQQVDTTLFEFLIGGFARKLLAQLEYAAPRRYYPLIEELSTIRGRIDLDHQARTAPGARIRVLVPHAPLQGDNALSRLIKSVVEIL